MAPLAVKTNQRPLPVR